MQALKMNAKYPISLTFSVRVLTINVRIRLKGRALHSVNLKITNGSRTIKYRYSTEKENTYVRFLTFRPLGRDNGSFYSVLFVDTITGNRNEMGL